jgi:hypothetical protein
VTLFSLSILYQQTRLFLWFRAVRSLVPHFLGWVSPSAESPIVGADVNPNCLSIYSCLGARMFEYSLMCMSLFAGVSGGRVGASYRMLPISLSNCTPWFNSIWAVVNSTGS